MDKKFVFLASLFLIVSFSAGVFTEIAVPSEKNDDFHRAAWSCSQSCRLHKK